MRAIINERIEAKLSQRLFERLPTKLAVVALRERDAAVVNFLDGEIGLAVQASCSIGRVFAPVSIGSERFLDADTYSPLPASVARALGASRVIAVDVTAYAGSEPTDVPEEWKVRDRERRANAAREHPNIDLLIHPDIGYYAPHSKAQIERAILIGEQTAKIALAPPVSCSYGLPSESLIFGEPILRIVPPYSLPFLRISTVYSIASFPIRSCRACLPGGSRASPVW